MSFSYSELVAGAGLDSMLPDSHPVIALPWKSRACSVSSQYLCLSQSPEKNTGRHHEPGSPPTRAYKE